MRKYSHLELKDVMGLPLHGQLSRRESQIMDIVFEMGQATAAQILERLPDPPSNSTVRVLLSILEGKGHLTHHRVTGRFVYQPTLLPEKAKRSALAHLLHTFFGGSAPEIVATLLSTAELTASDLDDLAALIERARREGK